MEFFIFRINKIKIYNNREWGPGEAKILSFITGEDVNNLGKTIDSIIDAPEFDGFTANVLTLATAATNPAAVAGLAIAKYVFGLVADTMMEKKDDQIGIVYQSFNRFEHYPHGERKKDDVPDLSNNIRFSYSIFGTTY
jgi:hypothetical protein